MSHEPSRAAVLVADDEPLVRWALKRTLSGPRHDVVLAGSRDEVCGLLASHHFEVVVVASEMGRRSMADVLNGLSRDHRPRGLVILCDGDNAEEVGRTFPDAVLVQKPFGLEAVTSAIEAFLEVDREAG